MELISNAEAALLGLLKDGPMYPYQIEKEVQQRDMRFWTELSMSSIYKLLQKLEKRGVVSSEVEISEANRTRKRYQLTDSGREALTVKLRELLSEPEHTRWRIDIGISFLGLLGSSEVQGCLAKYRKGLEERIKGYKELAVYMKNAGCPATSLGLASRPIHLLEGEIRWLDSYINQIKEENT